jgi:hypothetical protein
VLLVNIKLVVLLALISAATAAIGYNNKAYGVVSTTTGTEFHIHLNPKTANSVFGFGGGVDDRKAPIATSGDKNVYVAWSSNKTGNNEVMFKASTHGGKTFSDKMNLSNSSKSESVNVQIGAAGSNVYVTWWERNATSNEPVIRVSNDNGKTFGEKIILSAK